MVKRYDFSIIRTYETPTHTTGERPLSTIARLKREESPTGECVRWEDYVEIMEQYRVLLINLARGTIKDAIDALDRIKEE
jgi:hypothetical protein